MKQPENRKPIEFTVPVYGDGAFYVMENKGVNFYDYYHRHREFQISYLIKGNASLMLGNLLRPCGQDEVFLVKPNDPHMFIKEEGVSENATVHVIHLFFSLEKLRPFFDMTEMQAIKALFYDMETSKMLPSDFTGDLKELFLSLHMEDGPEKLIQVLYIFKKILAKEHHFISIYSGLSKVDFHDSDGLRINTVIKYAIDNYRKNITVDEVSALIHMTPTAFCKFFKKHTKKTFVTFLNEIRIEKACQLLINNRVENISEAAYQCGFNTAVHFNRVFRNLMKVSPSQFISAHTVKAF
ncbi:AraC family transcriptional regulator [Sphingobacterium wenxiniae]|uniref:AraC-type DNA-binding protein n=1 Tax=Sphingobacterium wenxiniae TaxID=683125 RepID=A0A1I6P1H9_9SPHI|nr:helix-turn-helix domain-containing protein [Sphingobacterium wenxiniae]SFS34031.1 AraC-type DNA-binding protein [Sphingobacterium wenxiniae]